jgi:hypothetical protein
VFRLRVPEEIGAFEHSGHCFDRRPARDQVNEGVMVKARQHANGKLVWEVSDGLLCAVAERQMRVLQASSRLSR